MEREQQTRTIDPAPPDQGAVDREVEREDFGDLLRTDRESGVHAGLERWIRNSSQPAPTERS